MNIYTCDICHKTFPTTNSLSGYKRMHGKSNGALPDPIKCCCIISKKEVAVMNLNKHIKAIRFCNHCGKLLEKDQIKYCSRSCVAKTTNTMRIKTEETRNKTSDSLKERYYKLHPEKLISYEGPYTKIYYVKCKHCNCISCSPNKRKYCSSCSHLYDKTFRNRYKFTFNVFHYPDLFDLDMITKIGWYSRGGTAGKWNPNGLTRDHKVSVIEAIKNNYDPYYIIHPMNCEIMSWLENNQKKTKSSISYEELVIMVNEYDLNKVKVIV